MVLWPRLNGKSSPFEYERWKWCLLFNALSVELKKMLEWGIYNNRYCSSCGRVQSSVAGYTFGIILSTCLPNLTSIPHGRGKLSNGNGCDPGVHHRPGHGTWSLRHVFTFILLLTCSLPSPTDRHYRNQNNAVLEASKFLNWKAERIATNCSEKVSVNIQATLPIGRIHLGKCQVETSSVHFLKYPDVLSKRNISYRTYFIADRTVV